LGVRGAVFALNTAKKEDPRRSIFSIIYLSFLSSPHLSFIIKHQNSQFKTRNN